MSQNILKNRKIAGILIGTITTFIISIFLLTNFLNSWHLKIADTLYTRNNPSDEIIIIAIDNSSTLPAPQGLGKFDDWSRNNYVKLLEKLGNEPKVIAFDIIFNAPTEQLPFETIKQFQNSIQENISNEEKTNLYETFLTENSSTIKNSIDAEFSQTIKKFDNIILAFNSNNGNPTFPLEKFSSKAKVGDIAVTLDNDGILRRANPFFYSKKEDKYYFDLGIEAVKEYLDAENFKKEDISSQELRIKTPTKEIQIPLENEKFNVNYFGDPFKYTMIPFVDVINGNFEEGFFKNKIVLIGVTEPRVIQDTVLTPPSNKTEMPGIEFRANEIQTILDEKFLTNQSKLSQILTTGIISIGLALILNNIGILFSIFVTVFLLIGYYVSGHLAYRNGLILNMLYPFIAIILTYIASWIYKYFIADKTKREISSAFSHYVSDKLVEEISKNPDMVKLGGEKRIITVFFSDIKNSTQLSEKTEISLWVSQINEYFTVMESIIKKYGGTIDKYEGDAIMGFWNAPLIQENHVALAYTAILEMKKTLKFLHEKWEKEGKPLLEFRVGINTGESIVGNFGSANRFDYTAMGDTVNTASRLESSANKTYGTSIIVAGFENNASGEELSKVIMRELDSVLLPGKNEPVKLYELLCLSEEMTPEIKNIIKIYAAALESYKNKNWQSAIDNFGLLENDLPSKIMLGRCQKLQNGEKVEGLDENMIFRIINK